MSRRRLPQRARTALLWGLAAFAALQLGLAVAIARWLPELRDPFYGYKAEHLRRRLAGASPRPLTVVMVGSSRTVYGLRAGDLEERLRRDCGAPVVVFNFGIFGAGPVTELLTLKRLLADGVRPDLLLVEVLPALLTGQEAAPLEAHWLPATRLRLPEVKLLGHYGFPAREMCRTWWTSWPVPWYAHRFALVSRVAPAWVPFQLRQDWGRADDASGWSGPPTAPATPADYRRGVERASTEYRGPLTQFRLGGPACEALEELLQTCRREHIAATLVLMPEGSEFRSWYPSPVWNEIRGYLGELSHRHGAPVVDARQWVADGDFTDSHHLLAHGAAVFTERLGATAVQPWLAGHTAENQEPCDPNLH